MNKEEAEIDRNNLCLVVIGMSGTGKTTFVSRIHKESNIVHAINLDPAVKTIPYEPFVDIRKTHDYKKVMKEYKLGPNGAILTALNLYLSQPENIVKKVEEKMQDNQSSQRKIFIVDIPGQIEVFTWSASSIILIESISTLMPVKILYTIDSNRCQNPNVFLSNLLFAESIKYRFLKFDFCLLLNKCDAADGDRLLKWIKDYEEFMKAIQQQDSHLSSLSRSVVLHLSELYEKTSNVKISAKTGYGFSDLEKMIDFKLRE